MNKDRVLELAAGAGLNVNTEGDHPDHSFIDRLMPIIDLYEKALLAAFPQGASGEAFEYWNEARKALNKI